MEVKQGKTTRTIEKNKKKSITEITFDNGFVINIYEGNLSNNDIIVQYSKSSGNQRTPKHIHWVVDFLMKRQGRKKLTMKLLKRIRETWDNISSLKKRDHNSLKQIIESIDVSSYVRAFKKLNKYGEYRIDFLLVAMELLMIQEKTNNSNAFMFKNVLDGLLEDELDIFSVVGTASFRGSI